MKASTLWIVCVILALAAVVSVAQDKPAVGPPGGGMETGPGMHQGLDQGKLVDRLLQRLGVEVTPEQKAEVLRLAKERQEKIRAAQREFVEGLKTTLNLTDEQLKKLVAAGRMMRQRGQRFHRGGRRRGPNAPQGAPPAPPGPGA